MKEEAKRLMMMIKLKVTDQDKIRQEAYTTCLHVHVVVVVVARQWVWVSDKWDMQHEEVCNKFT